MGTACHPHPDHRHRGFPPRMTDFKDYQRNRAQQRIIMAREILGNQCVNCGSRENLEFDHVDPSSKVGNVSEIANWTLERFLGEVSKCQLLCSSCHTQKTNKENYELCPVTNQGWYRCPCGTCRERKRLYHTEYMRKYRQRKTNGLLSPRSYKALKG